MVDLDGGQSDTAGHVWLVGFSGGGCSRFNVYSNDDVRAVRSK